MAHRLTRQAYRRIQMSLLSHVDPASKVERRLSFWGFYDQNDYYGNEENPRCSASTVFSMVGGALVPYTFMTKARSVMVWKIRKACH
ncbi:hypothetical protein AAE478_002011 [Parahypoxylon ruwenzoriense]